MKKSSFHFDLPKHLIAKRPLEKRSSSRLLVLGNNGQSEHLYFYDLVKVLKPGDLLVFNNTKVVPARMFGKKQTGGAVEILVERILSEYRVRAQVKASKSPKPDSDIVLERGQIVRVSDRDESMFILDSQEPWIDIMEDIGHMPLPPYIDREDEAQDRTGYQTVFARESGAVAAPTAGLHFDAGLLDQLSAMGVESAEVTLHVGAGTYQPVRVDDIADHKMHSEWLRVDADVVHKVKQTKQQGGRVVAVGTTAVRSLESAYEPDVKELKPFAGETDIFLYPGKSFNVVDALITNFHLSESTLLMLVSAFSGYTNILKAYAEAVEQEYRFFSYGDAMFLTHNKDAESDIPK